MTAVNVVMSSSLIRTRIPSGGSFTRSDSCFDTRRRTAGHMRKGADPWPKRRKRRKENDGTECKQLIAVWQQNDGHNTHGDVGLPEQTGGAASLPTYPVDRSAVKGSRRWPVETEEMVRVK